LIDYPAPPQSSFAGCSKICITMQNQHHLVSIIIPAYNSASYIEETVRSIFAQTYDSWELIIVNDGSTDKTSDITKAFKDRRIQTITQKNAGVAASRNKGLFFANGEFVVFFDADDLMTPDFLQERVNALQNDQTIGYVGGLVQSFPAQTIVKKAAAADPVNEILFFNATLATVPSNYMFRKKILMDNGIRFNRELSSTADRFFILEVSKFAKGKNLAGEKGKLLYRFTSQSMSNNVTPSLIIDNEKFYFELKRKNLLPSGKVQKFKSSYFLSLAKGFGLVKCWKQGLKYLLMSFINHPVFFIKSFGKTIFAFPGSRGIKMNG
jgi:glycosyltransferase involved in cell wall biosynthesis